MYLTVIKTLLSQIKLKHILILVAIAGMVLAFIFYNRAKKFKEEAEIKQNNLEAYQESTKIQYTAFGKALAERNIMYYTTKELNNSQAEEIKDLRNIAREANIKINRTESLLRTQISINEQLKSKVHIDEVPTSAGDSTTVTYIERDTAIIQTLKIIREYTFGADSADYDVSYHPILYVLVDRYKEGNWKIKNLFRWRDWQYKVNVISNDSILKPEDVIYIKNIDNE